MGLKIEIWNGIQYHSNYVIKQNAITEILS